MAELNKENVEEKEQIAQETPVETTESVAPATEESIVADEPKEEVKAEESSAEETPVEETAATEESDSETTQTQSTETVAQESNAEELQLDLEEEPANETEETPVAETEETEETEEIPVEEIAQEPATKKAKTQPLEKNSIWNNANLWLHMLGIGEKPAKDKAEKKAKKQSRKEKKDKNKVRMEIIVNENSSMGSTYSNGVRVDLVLNNLSGKELELTEKDVDLKIEKLCK